MAPLISNYQLAAPISKRIPLRECFKSDKYNLTCMLLLMGLCVWMALGADSQPGEAEAVRRAEQAWAQAALKGDALIVGLMLIRGSGQNLPVASIA